MARDFRQKKAESTSLLRGLRSLARDTRASKKTDGKAKPTPGGVVGWRSKHRDHVLSAVVSFLADMAKREI